MDEDVDQLKEEWIAEAVQVLKQGRGHMGIINHLRSHGLSPDAAKTVSYHVFDKALIRLKRAQLLIRITAWILVAIGVLLPLVFLISGHVVYYAFTPAVFGLGMLSRLPNPKRLPRESKA